MTTLKELRAENDVIRDARLARDVQLAQKIVAELAKYTGRGPFYSNRAMRRSK